jgi:hypothetical protein
MAQDQKNLVKGIRVLNSKGEAGLKTALPLVTGYGHRLFIQVNGGTGK